MYLSTSIYLSIYLSIFLSIYIYISTCIYIHICAPPPPREEKLPGGGGVMKRRTAPTTCQRVREFLIDNLLVRIHWIIKMILVDRPCAMDV